MNQQEKSALSKTRILYAALQEFSEKGYEGAALNAVWAREGISKGSIYHHFKDKDELYLLCVENCFTSITAYLRKAAEASYQTLVEGLQGYFDARLHFFSEKPEYLGIFVDASFNPPKKLLPQILRLRQDFDELNVSVLARLLKTEPLRPGLSVETAAEDFRMYMDYFNAHFKAVCGEQLSPRELLYAHEERCHRQLDIFLYGVLGKKTVHRKEPGICADAQNPGD